MRYFNFKFIWGKLKMFKKLTSFLTLVFLAACCDGLDRGNYNETPAAPTPTPMPTPAPTPAPASANTGATPSLRLSQFRAYSRASPSQRPNLHLSQLRHRALSQMIMKAMPMQQICSMVVFSKSI